jgi:hypothetical protein
MKTLGKWCLALYFCGFAAILFGQSDNNQIQSQTIWKGTCTQSCMEPYEMILKIENRKENEISGTIDWPLVRCRTKIQGHIIDNNISFTENSIIEGSGVVLHTTYLGKIESNTITGTWLHKEKTGVASGNFKIIKDDQSK